MRIAGLIVVAVIVVASQESVQSHAAGTDPCVYTDPDKAVAELQRAPNGPALLNTTFFLPAGAPVDLILKEKYQIGTVYFGHVEGELDDQGIGKTNIAIGPDAISAKKVPDKHPLVEKGEASPNDTLISIQLPPGIGGGWEMAKLYIFTCSPGVPEKPAQGGNPEVPAIPGNPAFKSVVTMPVTSAGCCIVAAWFAVAVIYILAAIASKVVDKQSLGFSRYLDPVVLTAGSNGKGNLPKLQIVFFSIIVFGLLAYIVLRTGILSDISPTVVILLGISGVGSAASKATDVNRNRIVFENWAWFIRKHWLPGGGLAEVNQARWRDLVTSDGEFDVYHFQSLIFSLVVGGALIAAGLSQLSTFEIPQTLLEVLGLSQAVYIGGKLVSPPSCADLNKATSQLRLLERDFATAAMKNTDPNLRPGGPQFGPPANLVEAIRRAGADKYASYIDLAKTVRVMFETVTGQQVGDGDIEPALSA